MHNPPWTLIAKTMTQMGISNIGSRNTWRSQSSTEITLQGNLFVTLVTKVLCGEKKSPLCLDHSCDLWCVVQIDLFGALCLYFLVSCLKYVLSYHLHCIIYNKWRGIEIRFFFADCWLLGFFTFSHSFVACHCVSLTFQTWCVTALSITYIK